MIELLVVIGVILIVLGIAIPSIARSMEQARNTAELATIRSNVSLLFQFAEANQDTYPLARPGRCGSGRFWYEPLITSGLMGSESDADPRSFPKFGAASFTMSESVVADPGEFTWGSTRPCTESPSAAVAQSDVSFPSSKGLMVRAYDPARVPAAGFSHAGEDATFCCTDLWPAPVAFCDGSGVVGTYVDFAPGGLNVNWAHNVGIPITSPWGGYRARER